MVSLGHFQNSLGDSVCRLRVLACNKMSVCYTERCEHWPLHIVGSVFLQLVLSHEWHVFVHFADHFLLVTEACEFLVLDQIFAVGKLNVYQTDSSVAN